MSAYRYHVLRRTKSRNCKHRIAGDWHEAIMVSGWRAYALDHSPSIAGLFLLPLYQTTRRKSLHPPFHPYPESTFKPIPMLRTTELRYYVIRASWFDICTNHLICYHIGLPVRNDNDEASDVRSSIAGAKCHGRFCKESTRIIKGIDHPRCGVDESLRPEDLRGRNRT